MRYLSLCCIIRDEELYLQEWLDFYRKQGVEHFYIYDNDSTIDPKPLFDAPDITWHKLSGMMQQRVAYNHTIEKYRNETEWVAFLDTDEYFYSTKDARFVDTLKKVYDSPGIAGVAAHWLLFGSSGHLEYSPEPVTKRFTMRAASTNHHVKSIMRLSQTLSMGNDPHSFRATGDIIDENFSVLPLDYAIHSPATSDILRINHYHTKSKAEYWKRRKNPDANSGEYKDAQIMWEAHDVNEIEDKEIWDRL